MSNSANPLPTEQVSCEICMKEIPVSEAKSEEATEYVMYFCGLNCYESWRAQGNNDTE